MALLHRRLFRLNERLGRVAEDERLAAAELECIAISKTTPGATRR